MEQDKAKHAEGEEEIDDDTNALALQNEVKAVQELEQQYNVALTEEQRKLRDVLTIKRSIYEMDEFVKMNQVRNICQEMLNAVFDKLQRSEVVARQNKE